MPIPPRRYTLVQDSASSERASFAGDVAQGLTSSPKSLPCRYFYDEEGSKLFEEICELPEYYLTRCEREILEERSQEIAGAFPGPITLAELGSGSSSKTRLLIEALLQRHGDLRYLPVDVSRTMLEESSLELIERYDDLEVRAIASEYERGLHHVHAERDRPRLVAWLGSTIGNLERGEASSFLAEVREGLGAPDRILVGIDLRKERDVLERAYDDGAGVTARFNRNLLERINRELGADFAPLDFEHRAYYHEVEGRVEMHLVSRRDQLVSIDGLDLEIELLEGEGIHTENSHKYDLEEIDTLAAAAGLAVADRWLDHEQQFSVNLFAPR